MQIKGQFWKPESYPSAGFIQHVLAVIGILALTYLVWQVRTAFLLGFAGILVAVLLLTAAAPIRRWTALSLQLSVAAAAMAILAVLCIVFWLIGSQIQSQVADFLTRVPQAMERLEQQF